MHSFFKKLTNSFKKLFRIENKVQIIDEPVISFHKELFKKIKLRERIIAEKEAKLKDGFIKLKKYRDLLVSVKNEFDKEKKMLQEKIDIANKEASHCDTLSKQYKLEILSLNEKNEQILMELNKQKEIVQDLLEAKSNTEQIIQSDSTEMEALKNLGRELHIENKKLQKIIEESKDREKHLLTLVELKSARISGYTEPADDLRGVSRIEESTTDKHEMEIILPTEEETHTTEVPIAQTVSEGYFTSEFDDLSAIIEEISKDIDLVHHSTPEIESQKKESYIIEPESRGGRPRRIAGSSELIIKESIDEKVKRYRPKIVCWKEERVWHIAIELPDDVIDGSEVTVSQNSVPLEMDGKREGYFKLRSVAGKIHTTSVENNIAELDLGNEGYLVFKLNAGNPNEGILVKRTSRGNYLAIVPSDWQFDENISGSQITGAEQTNLKDYSAHHYSFTNKDKRKVGFINLNNESITVDTLGAFYSLNGNLIEDCAEKQGPLFGKKLPTIEITDIDQWARIDCIIIGEEGDDRENWREKILTYPDLVSLELSDYLPDVISGWYFIRFYDSDLQLVDSCDFRFISSLLKIDYNNLNLIPDEFGHTEAEIELIHTAEFSMKWDKDNSDGMEVMTLNSEKTRIKIKPNSEIDKLSLEIVSKDWKNISLFLPTERIWWSLNHGESPGLWEDKIVTLIPNDFLTLNNSIFIRFPANGWASSIRFGFQAREPRIYPIRSDQKIVKIPLKYYSDSENEMNSLGSYNLVCEIIHNGKPVKFIPFKVVVNANCKFCSHFESPDITKILNHILDQHFEEVYIEPLYDDIQPLLPHLPKRIYQCVFCIEDNPTYVKAYSHNPVEEIIRHIDTGHRGQDHRFRIVDEIDEIRQLISIEIPIFKKCKYCSDIIPESELKTHLIRKHKKDITIRL